ncbi:MAG: YdeI/OmpD-associated family protein [Pseudomonadota bacterium]
MSRGIDTDKFAKIDIKSAADLWQWLEVNHRQDDSVWLVTFKKSVPEHYVSTSDVLDALIAFGWIDGIRRKLDDDRTMQLIAKRKAQHWSKTYKDRAARLEAEGRLMSAGRTAIATSKKSGLWNFLDDVDALVIPDDLLAALQSQGPAHANFLAYSDSVQRFALRDIKLAKTAPTRQKRINDVVSRARRGELPRGVRMPSK